MCSKMAWWHCIHFIHRWSWGPNRSLRSKVRKPVRGQLKTSIWTSYFLHWTRHWVLALDTLKLGLPSHKAWPGVSNGSTELGGAHWQSWPRKAPGQHPNPAVPPPQNTCFGGFTWHRAVRGQPLACGLKLVLTTQGCTWAGGFPWAKARWARFRREAIANGQGDLAFHPCSFNPLCAGMFHCRDNRAWRDRRWCQKGGGGGETVLWDLGGGEGTLG